MTEILKRFPYLDFEREICLYFDVQMLSRGLVALISICSYPKRVPCSNAVFEPQSLGRNPALGANV
jgi:hypothetical protein